MTEQLRGPFEKFVVWRQCASVMLLRRGKRPLYNILSLRNSALLTVPVMYETAYP